MKRLAALLLAILLSACATGNTARDYQAQAAALDAQAQAAQAKANAAVGATADAIQATSDAAFYAKQSAEMTAQAQAAIALQATATAEAELSSLAAQATRQAMDAQSVSIQATAAGLRATIDATNLQATQDYMSAGIASRARQTQEAWSVSATQTAAVSSQRRADGFVSLVAWLLALICVGFAGTLAVIMWRWAETKRRAIETALPHVTMQAGMAFTWDGSTWRTAQALPAGDIPQAQQAEASERERGEMERFVARAIDIAGDGAVRIPRWSDMSMSASVWHRLTNELMLHGWVTKGPSGTVLRHGNLTALLAWAQAHEEQQDPYPTRGYATE